ncbi:ATP-grasp domain-containing protein [Streptomyces cinnamoneus]|uniref:Argininosuccinate lyase n=1 Tax=Streptomyces cinnamoneus TaxID=53446 RepID=A0A918TJG4_STRCJ|nr:ATP-grasp domain-containing protein [Streptomyces cinnamoneus]GHC47722.1 argininosuccinate lyase [Streptomyces cinnamoneus]
MNVDDRPVIIVGYTAGWKYVAERYHRQTATLFVDTPTAAREKNLVAVLAAADASCRLIVTEYEEEDAAARFHREYRGRPPAAVIPGIEYTVPFAARLAELFGLPGAGARAADPLRDKWLLRQVTADSDVRSPVSRTVSAPQDVRALMAEVGGPVVLKPANRQGSIGTRIVRTPDDVDDAWAECVVQEHAAMAAQSIVPVRMLAESHLRGPEFSVELLVHDGRTLFRNVTAKSLFPGDRPVELGHTVPADITAAAQARLHTATETVLETIGFESGFVHCEWIVVDGEPHLVECAGRMPGGSIVKLVELAWNVDITREYLSVMRGSAPSTALPEHPTGGAASWFLSAGPGEVVRLDGVLKAADSPGVSSVELLVGIGSLTRSPRSGRDRVGSVIAADRNGAGARQRARDAAALIDIGVRPTP